MGCDLWQGLACSAHIMTRASPLHIHPVGLRQGGARPYEDSVSHLATRNLGTAGGARWSSCCSQDRRHQGWHGENTCAAALPRAPTGPEQLTRLGVLQRRVAMQQRSLDVQGRRPLAQRSGQDQTCTAARDAPMCEWVECRSRRAFRHQLRAQLGADCPGERRREAMPHSREVRALPLQATGERAHSVHLHLTLASHSTR
mmetsp:Transcript_6992/g.20328  ORF Transcript_6992/g.20328 Transcript_6992/m.20328 type:complete len:200 (-) Transcript_6992:3608-4207(-)